MTTGSAAGTSSRRSDTCDAAKEVPIFKQPTGRWSLTGFLITCRKQKVNRGVEVTDPDTWLDPLFAKSSKQKNHQLVAGCIRSSGPVDLEQSIFIVHGIYKIQWWCHSTTNIIYTIQHHRLSLPKNHIPLRHTSCFPVPLMTHQVHPGP